MYCFVITLLRTIDPYISSVIDRLCSMFSTSGCVQRLMRLEDDVCIGIECVDYRVVLEADTL